MSKAGILGSCKYCGQVRTLGLEYENESEERRNKAATDQCDCARANHDRRIQKSVNEAKVNIDELFATNHPETCEVLKTAVAHIKNEKIASITIDNGDGTKAKVKTTSKGAIVVELAVSKKTSREVL